MKNPIKIIHKFKNNNKNIQYKVYIFIGSIVPKKVSNILDIIINKDYYNALNIITKEQYVTLENF